MDINYFFKDNMNKKGAGHWFGLIITAIIVIILIVLIIILAVIVGNSKSKDDNQMKNTLKFYLNAKDYDTKEQLIGEYLVRDMKGNILSNGDLEKDSLIEINSIPYDEQIEIDCWNENHYMSIEYKNFTRVEIQNNASKFTCYPKEAGNIKLEQIGNIGDGIIINISTDKHFNKVSALFSWTVGISEVVYQNKRKDCDTNWTNLYYYNSTEEINQTLPEGYYSCNGNIDKCKEIDGFSCILEGEIPLRYLNRVDSAVYTGITIDNGYYELPIKVRKNELFSEKDFINVTIYDQDLRFIGNELVYISQINGKDIESPDSSIIVR